MKFELSELEDSVRISLEQAQDLIHTPPQGYGVFRVNETLSILSCADCVFAEKVAENGDGLTSDEDTLKVNEYTMSHLAVMANRYIELNELNEESAGLLEKINRTVPGLGDDLLRTFQACLDCDGCPISVGTARKNVATLRKLLPKTLN